MKPQETFENSANNLETLIDIKEQAEQEYTPAFFALPGSKPMLNRYQSCHSFSTIEHVADDTTPKELEISQSTFEQRSELKAASQQRSDDSQPMQPSNTEAGTQAADVNSEKMA
jgi:hypothetical protein